MKRFGPRQTPSSKMPNTRLRAAAAHLNVRIGQIPAKTIVTAGPQQKKLASRLGVQGPRTVKQMAIRMAHSC